MNRNKEEEQSVPLTQGSDDDLDSEYGSQSSSTPFNGRPIPRRRNPCRAHLCTLLCFVLCAAIFTFIGAQITRHNLDLDGRCAAYTTQWSPVLKEVDVKYGLKQFNGSFMEEDIYRQRGSPEVDVAWEALGVDYRPGIISQADGLASGLGPGHVQISQKYGGGFIVNVEGMHHLHCLNLVRKSLYFNYDYYKGLGEHAFANEDRIVHLHVTHCLDTIRQVLMCSPDTGVLGQVWSSVSHDHGGGGHGGNHDSAGQHPNHPVGAGGHVAPPGDNGEQHAHDETTAQRRRSLPGGRRGVNAITRRHGDDDNDNSSQEHAQEHAQEHTGSGQPSAFPDFKTVHKCKNFDAIRAYAKKIQAPPNEDLPPDFLAKPDPRYVVQGTP